MTDHAAMSPSSAAMWMSCPASITKAEGRTRPSSRYAREGTAAHKIAETIISGNMFPPGKITVEGEQFIVGIPMLKALNPYIDVVQRLQAMTRHVHVEARVGFRYGGGLVWGTADCAALIRYRQGINGLSIVDLKYGMGVLVSPDSPQLKIYALAAIDTFWPETEITNVDLTIVQPRLDPLPQQHNMVAEELYSWRDEELLPAVDRILDGDQTEHAGPHCRWCVRKTECAAFAAARIERVFNVFDDGVVDSLNS